MSVLTPLPSDETPARHIEPTRARLAAVYVALVLGLVAAERWLWPALHGVAALPPCESLPWVRLELSILLALLFAWAAWLFMTGRRMWRLQQTPLPDAWVWTRTEIRTGWRARTHAAGLLLLSGLLVLGPLYVLVRHELYLIYAFWLPCAGAARCAIN